MPRNTIINVGQGESYRKLIVLSEISGSTEAFYDITDYNFSGSIRETYSMEPVSVNFTIEKALPYTSGSFYIVLSPEQTRNLENQDYVYDVIMVSGSVSDRVLEGMCIIRPSVTR